jgi:hypothetical protein
MIRTLLTLPDKFVPHEITSLMEYPGQASTHAKPSYFNRIRVEFAPQQAVEALSQSAVAASAHSATTGKSAPIPVVTTNPLTAEEWSRLMVKVTAIPIPAVSAQPSKSAIPDPKTKP